MKTKKLLWKISEETTLLIDPKEVSEQVYLGGAFLEINDELSTEQQEFILEKLREKEEQGELDVRWMSDDEFQEVLEEIGIDVFVSVADEWIDPDENVILFSREELSFWKPSELEKTKVYEWWDGSNWERVILEAYMDETVVEITEKSVCLDEWDGRNWQTRGMGLHEYVHKVITIDGEEVEDMFLLVNTSQWQGSHPTGEILTVDEVRDHLKEIGRDVEKYMYEVGSLSGE